MKRVIQIVCGAVILMSVVSASMGSGFWEVQQLTDDEILQAGVRICGERVVWTGPTETNAHYQVRLYDGSQTTMLTNDTHHNYRPDVSESIVAWHCLDSHQQIKVFDGQSVSKRADIGRQSQMGESIRGKRSHGLARQTGLIRRCFSAMGSRPYSSRITI